VNPTPFPVSPLDPGPDIFGILAGFVGIGLVLYLGVTFLVIWGFYWLMRLAVRHGGMDVARWQQSGMPARMPKKYKLPRTHGGGSYFER
jgi:hypothetical protein